MWTLEQEAAIHLRNCDLLVSAAAGSGKTAVLVERITKLIIEEQVPIDQMLIVTYTNAAAGEMRERIEKALSNALASEGGNRFLQDQLKRLNRAYITTFHSFCLDIVRQHFEVLEIDPTFRMANESEKQIMRHQAMEMTLEAFYKREDSAFVNLVEGYSGNRDDQKIREMVMGLHRFIQSQAYPIKWLDAQITVEKENKKKHWYQFIVKAHKKMLGEGIELLKYGADQCMGVQGLEGYTETFEEDINSFKRLINTDAEAFAQAVSGFAFSRMKPIKKGMKDLIDPMIVKEVKDEIRDKIIKKNIFEKIKSFYAYKEISRYFDELDVQQPLIEVINALVCDYDLNYSQLKNGRNTLDFNDLEHLAIHVLDDDEIASRYSNAFRYLFVDEYQDASGIQEHILTRIKRPDNLFMVGDIKQSIYKFRLADPEIFIRKYTAFKRFDQFGVKSVDDIKALNETFKDSDAPMSVRVDLSKNFRTRGEILEAVNDLFEGIMSPDLGDITYDDQARLYQGMAFQPFHEVPIEVNLISKALLSDEDDGSAENYLEDMKTDEIEARASAMRIKKLIGQPIFHPKRNAYVPCTFKDIVILIRSVRAWTPIFETVFAEEGLPLFADNPAGYFDTLEVRFIMALIKVIANPYDDLALLTVLHSPVVDLSIEALIDIKTSHDKYDYLFDALFTCKDVVSETTYQKVKQFLDNRESWSKVSKYTPIDQFIWHLLKSSKLYDYCMTMPGGQARIANLNLLVERATEFKQSEIVSLTQFVQFISDLKRASGDMGVANSIGEQDNVIRLMSIHKSKGLEFPVVFLLGLGRKFNMQDTYGDLLMHQDEGLALSFVDTHLRTKSKTLPQEVIKMRLRHETYSEELRVLYVALTRPVDRLIVYGTYADTEKKWLQWARGNIDYHISQPQGYMDWLMSRWYHHPLVNVIERDAVDLTDMAVVQMEDWQTRVSKWQKPDEMVKNHMVMDKISEILSFSYPTFTSYQPTKVSVSEIAKGFQTPEIIKSPIFLSDRKITAAEKGTLTHLLLEHIDLHQAHTKQDLMVLLASLVKKGIIKEEEKHFIDLDKIIAFTSSSLGLRLRKIQKHVREVPFVIKKDEQYVQGVIDFYAETENGIVLLDYKTDYEVLHMRMAKHKQQLIYYKEAIEAMQYKPVIEAYVVFLMAEEIVAIDL